MIVVALVLALSMLSFYVHLLRASVYRAEAARLSYEPQTAQANASLVPVAARSR